MNLTPNDEVVNGVSQEKQTVPICLSQEKAKKQLEQGEQGAGRKDESVLA